MNRVCGFLMLLAVVFAAAQDNQTDTNSGATRFHGGGHSGVPGGQFGSQHGQVFGSVPGRPGGVFQQGQGVGSFPGRPGVFQQGQGVGSFPGRPGVFQQGHGVGSFPGRPVGGSFPNIPVGGSFPGIVPGGNVGIVPHGVSPVIHPLPSNPLGGCIPGVTTPSPIGCKNYVRDPCGNYVCDVDQKPFQCPRPRPQCPPTRFGGPRLCRNDFDCPGSDKCCSDVCLQQLVCKPHE